MEIKQQPCNNKNQKRKRGLWSPNEDEKLYNFITRYGVSSWSSLPKQAGLERCAKSCRLRWFNYLNPELKKEPISQEEEDLIIALHNKLGNRWARIAESLPGRTDNEIKNYYNCHIKKKHKSHHHEISVQEINYTLTVPAVTQPSSYCFQFQATGTKDESTVNNTISNLNLNPSTGTYSMINYSEIGVSNESKRCNYINFQSATQNYEIFSRLDNCK